MQKIGILAGGGRLPQMIAKEAKNVGNEVIICGFYGHTDEETLSFADVSSMFYLGQFSKVIRFFHDNNVKTICLAGTINKPKALEFRPDMIATKIIFSLKSKGDDALLRAIITQLEKEDLRIVAASTLVPALLCPAGVLTKKKPDEHAKSCLDYALPIMKTLSTFDIGQCLVVRENMVIAVECLEGTDATIKRGAELGKKDCVVVKLLKKGQDERVDLPSIGYKTIENLVEGSYSALIIEAGKTLFFDREESIKKANENNLVIWALENPLS